MTAKAAAKAASEAKKAERAEALRQKRAEEKAAKLAAKESAEAAAAVAKAAAAEAAAAETKAAEEAAAEVAEEAAVKAAAAAAAEAAKAAGKLGEDDLMAAEAARAANAAGDAVVAAPAGNTPSVAEVDIDALQAEYKRVLGKPARGAKSRQPAWLQAKIDAASSPPAVSASLVPSPLPSPLRFKNPPSSANPPPVAPPSAARRPAATRRPGGMPAGGTPAPVLQALREEYRRVFGKAPRGLRAGSADWLREQIAGGSHQKSNLLSPTGQGSPDSQGTVSPGISPRGLGSSPTVAAGPVWSAAAMRELSAVVASIPPTEHQFWQTVSRRLARVVPPAASGSFTAEECSQKYSRRYEGKKKRPLPKTGAAVAMEEEATAPAMPTAKTGTLAHKRQMRQMLEAGDALHAGDDLFDSPCGIRPAAHGEDSDFADVRTAKKKGRPSPIAAAGKGADDVLDDEEDEVEGEGGGNRRRESSRQKLPPARWSEEPLSTANLGGRQARLDALNDKQSQTAATAAAGAKRSAEKPASLASQKKRSRTTKSAEKRARAAVDDNDSDNDNDNDNGEGEGGNGFFGAVDRGSNDAYIKQMQGRQKALKKKVAPKPKLSRAEREGATSAPPPQRLRPAERPSRRLSGRLRRAVEKAEEEASSEDDDANPELSGSDD